MEADPYLAALMKETQGNLLVLDAGDSLHGGPEAILSKGKTMVDLMNSVGYYAMASGNHDYDYGAERLSELTSLMNFPVLAANVTYKDSGNLPFDDYEIFDFGNGFEVGVFGLATPETATQTNPKNVANLNFNDPIPVAQNMVTELTRQGADVIIAVAHLGDDVETQQNWRSSALAQAVPEIDVIIDGHSHAVLEHGVLVNGVLIAQTGAYAANIGKIDISVLPDGSIVKEANLFAVPKLPADNTALNAIPVIPVPPDPEISAVVAQIKKDTSDLTERVVGQSPYLLEGSREYVRKGETNLTDLVTDSLLAKTGAGIALLNGGGIRQSISAGPIRIVDVLNTLPFMNNVVTIDITGAQLVAALEWGVQFYPDANGGFPQVAGFSFTVDPNAQPLQRVSDVVLDNGEPIDASAMYTLATISFLADGGDGFTMLANHQNEIAYGQDYELFIEYIQTEPVISETSAGRIKFLSVGEFGSL
jgi:2',3'-cyclic-nucleotide 2'-phosphodiesterase (5'-nucleotidase family)